jgi:hypothetical protein
MPEQPDEPGQKKALRETSIASVMTSTSVHKHPTAFQSAQLPILEVALDVQRMREYLLPALAPLARPGTAPKVTYAKLLAYKQGNRGLIQYELAGIGASDPTLVYGKLFPALNQCERTYSIMRLLWDEIFGTHPRVSVPQPLGVIPELAMLVYLPAQGAFLNEIIADSRALEAMELSGTWLGLLHSHRLPLERRLQIATEVVNLQAWASLIGQKYPDEAETANRIASYLRERAGELTFQTDVPIHKDFHYGHIVVDGGLKIIDFDEMRLGDPNFDLAHFCANLHLLAYRNNDGPYVFSTLQRAFLSAYAAETGWVTNERFVYFYAYTCLKIAKQLCTMRGLRPRPEGEEQLRQVQLMLQQGLGSVPPDGARKLSRKFATMIARPDTPLEGEQPDGRQGDDKP